MWNTCQWAVEAEAGYIGSGVDEEMSSYRWLLPQKLPKEHSVLSYVLSQDPVCACESVLSNPVYC